MKKPVLYIQAHPDKSRHALFDFCYSAKMGAECSGIKVKLFQDSLDIPGDATNIVVGSVEMCIKWLENNNYPIPSSIPLSLFDEFLGRDITIKHIDDITFPSFIKPFSDIKAFTGFVATNKLYVDIFAEKFTGLVYMQEPIDIVSEYRMYVSNDNIIGMKHYSGDCLIFPNVELIKNCFNKSIELLGYCSYTLDFGVLADGRTILVEPNDAWAIGNYGIDPIDYYLFIRNRWLQITGVRRYVNKY